MITAQEYKKNLELLEELIISVNMRGSFLDEQNTLKNLVERLYSKDIFKDIEFTFERSLISAKDQKTIQYVSKFKFSHIILKKQLFEKADNNNKWMLSQIYGRPLNFYLHKLAEALKEYNLPQQTEEDKENISELFELTIPLERGKANLSLTSINPTKFGKSVVNSKNPIYILIVNRISDPLPPYSFIPISKETIETLCAENNLGDNRLFQGLKQKIRETRKTNQNSTKRDKYLGRILELTSLSIGEENGIMFLELNYNLLKNSRTEQAWFGHLGLPLTLEESNLDQATFKTRFPLLEKHLYVSDAYYNGVSIYESSISMCLRPEQLTSLLQVFHSK